MCSAFEEFDLAYNSDKLLSHRRQCEDKIFQIIKIKNKKKWTKEEDNLLIKLADKFREKHWKEISKNFVNKNALQCFSRYKRIRPGIIKGSWSKEEDERIYQLVNIYGKSWSKISKILVTRNGKQIRDRFINVLDPEIKKGKFTEEEDNTLIRLFKYYGPRWATIAKHFPNRTADMIKNRYHSSIKKLFFGNHAASERSNSFEKNNNAIIDNIHHQDNLGPSANYTSSYNSQITNHNSTINNTNSFNSNTSSQISFNYPSSKSSSPKNSECSLINPLPQEQMQPLQQEQHSQYPQLERYNIEDYREYNEYREYMNNEQEENNLIYDSDEIMNVNEAGEFSYESNSPIFNFDDYFTL